MNFFRSFLIVLFTVSFPSYLFGAAKADLSITKAASSTIVNESSAMSYSMTVTNLSASTKALAINVTDTLPSGMSFTSGNGTGWSCIGVGSPVTVTCSLTELEKGTSTLLTLNVTAPTSAVAGAVTFSNTASVATSGTDDIVPANNISPAISVTLNRAPVTVNDLFNTASHTAVSGNVLTNDSDLDGDSLSVTNAGTFTLSFGSLTIAANGAFTYTPGYFTGETDEYTYTVSDGRGGVTTGTLQIGIGSACTAIGLVNAEREFCLRKQTVLFGDMVTIGNTLVVPPSPQPASATQTTYCSTYTNGAFLADTPGLDNQSLYLCSYKPDTNLNATTAELSIPAGSTIKWAGLYLQSVVKHSDASALLSMNVKMKKDNGSYVDVGTPNVVNYGSYTPANSTSYDNYSAFIDVTSKFTANSWKDGSYTIANVPVTTDTLEGGTAVIGKYGAWSLVVIYENVSKPLKSVSIYDGWQKITGSTSSTSATITVDNFYTPTTGSIDSAVSIFAAEGDKYRTGDNFQGYKNSTSSWVNLGTTNNAFDSGIISAGSRTPLLNNNQGIDIETYQIGTSGYNLLSNAQSSISFKLSTGGDIDYFYPSMLAFSTEVYHPRMCYYEKLYDSNGNLLTTGSLVAKGSAIDVRVLLRNDMNEPAEKVMLYKTFNTALPYTPNSTSYKLNPVGLTVADMMTDTTAPLTDLLDGDIFDYSTPLKLFSLHAGTGATFNQGGDFTFGQEALFEYSTTANFDGNTSISYQIAYTMPTIGYRYEGELAKCEEFDNTFGVILQSIVVGNMDVIENISYANAGSYAAADKNIFAKMVNKDFNLEAVYLDTSGNEQVYNGIIGNKIVNMAVMLYTTDDTCTEEDQLIWRGQIVHNNSHATAVVDNIDVDTADEEEGFLLAEASPNRRIKANFIDYGTLINNTSDLNCATSSLDSSLCLVPACLNSDTQILNVFPLAEYPYVATCLYGDGGGAAPCDSSAYNGSCGGKKTTISPSKYNNDIGCAMCLADALGMDGCSSDNFSIRPDTYTSTISPSGTQVAGHDFSLTTVANGYNNTSLTGYDGDANVTAQTQITTCSVPDGNLTVGGVAPAVIHFNSVDTNVSNNVKFGDIGVFDVNITDSTWTAVDSTKNPIECIDEDDTNIADANGKIGCLIKTVINPTVIPDHFDINGTLTNGSNGFTYLNNFDTNASLDQDISATLNAVVTAKAFDINTTTQNYSSECYAKSGNSVLNITLNPSPPLGDLTQLLWYDDNNNSVVGNFAIAGPFSFPHPAARFTSGVGNLNYRLNFDRSIIAPVNPFQMTIPQMVVTDTDNVDGNNSIDNNATYLFGRTHASRQRYYDATAPYQGPANIYFESYCFTDCVKTLLPNGANSSRTDDVRWYIIPNPFHTTPTDGVVGTVVQKGGLNIVTASPQAPTTGNPSTTTLTYTGAKGFPYKTTMENNASIWLIHNENNDATATRNEFQVEFDLSGGWTGEHETNTTTKIPAGATTNRRIMW